MVVVAEQRAWCVEEQTVTGQNIAEQSDTGRRPTVTVRPGAARWWLQTVTSYMVVMYLAWVVHDLAVQFTPAALLASLTTLLFTFVMFGIPSVFMIGVVRLVEPKMPRWGFTLLSLLTAGLPLLLAPEAPALYLLLQLPAQVTLVVMLHLPWLRARRH